MPAEWHIDRLDLEPAEVETLAALLDPGELARAQRFHQVMHRRRFVVRRGRLRQWLGTQLGIAPGAVPVSITAMGKPFVPGWDRHFSASHSHETMLLACAPVPVGCDIERVQPDFDWRALAERLFAPEERQALAAMPDEAGRIAFFHCWARKEAFVKALGQGLAYPLDAFAVTCTARAELLRGGDGWALTALDWPDHAAAIVVQSA